MRLKINCDVCEARKINEDNYKEYEEIIISTDKMMVDDRSKQILHSLPFSIRADEIKSQELNEKQSEVQNINGIYEIGPDMEVKEGTILNVNGYIKVAPHSEEVLKKFEKIGVNGIILCPQSLSGKLPMQTISLNGVIKTYPDDYTLLENKYRLDKYFPLRTKENAGYFAASCIYDVDSETDFNKLAEKNVKLHTGKLYIRKSHLEKALPLVNIEAKIIELSDECQIVDDDSCELSEATITTYGNNLFVTGDMTIKGEALSALEKLAALCVEGTVRIDKDCVDKFHEIGGTCGKLVILEGHIITDQAYASLDRQTLENHPEGIRVSDCAILNVAADVPAALIRERLTIRDVAKIRCTELQKAAISEVSSDVAMIGNSGVMSNIFGSIFGRSDDDNNVYSDVKYVNADYYEL